MVFLVALGAVTIVVIGVVVGLHQDVRDSCIAKDPEHLFVHLYFLCLSLDLLIFHCLVVEGATSDCLFAIIEVATGRK